jgi:TPR repeat protein
MPVRVLKRAVALVALVLVQCADVPPLPADQARFSGSADDRLSEALAALDAGDGETAWFLLWDMAIDGDPAAQVNLASLYRDGTGIPPDPRLERRWLELAATAGQPLAQYRLGEIYETSPDDTVNRQAAELWYGRAAAQGLVPARAALARLRQKN